MADDEPSQVQPLVSQVAPTLTAEEIQAGALMELVLPSLPDAIRVAMPLDFRLSINALVEALALLHVLSLV